MGERNPRVAKKKTTSSMESRRGESIAGDEPRGCCRCGGRSSAGSSRKTRPRKSHALACPKSRRRSDDEDERREEEGAGGGNSCYDKFALAKRLHAENLQHQPLPDKVDDRVFRNLTAHGCRSAACEPARSRGNVRVARRDRCFADPALGYKQPETRMDLAICWETPVDPVYEPRKPAHIDGSEGGSAPAIFALIQHSPAPRNRELLEHGQEDKKGVYDCAGKKKKKKREADSGNRCCCECLCDGMETVTVAEIAEVSRGGKPARASSVPQITERRCAACEPDGELEKRRRDPRLIRSAVGIALGTREEKHDDVRRNGLPPAKLTVPRPRTPFARRAFCIDTLAPPFSVVHGCRDADYPEHWRLMSVYQQSYRNPQRRRAHHF
ncbi:PREDICTED: uncharacterized protein LOC106743941 [Dinoponera quadriceps]|uniref:Uncharacterized protein LOC106743941 n=1 Tax=Dinoponera quadriceps TaxID=609295 RepID=A0A6P3X6A4_DINQU|nr:PREDICTED: uncharacterized protein LOC106743941 [Dinoponera quadriceps]